jgi:hypothetical protein
MGEAEEVAILYSVELAGLPADVLESEFLPWISK